mmetsp:Transcript_40363/g.105181  ORF Transcript_40363/g.105181 Transcript_40363/m.105181 type:complete len:301 (+) Transcript_40363:882-1784(+)
MCLRQVRAGARAGLHPLPAAHDEVPDARHGRRHHGPRAEALPARAGPGAAGEAAAEGAAPRWQEHVYGDRGGRRGRRQGAHGGPLQLPARALQGGVAGAPPVQGAAQREPADLPHAAPPAAQVGGRRGAGLAGLARQQVRAAALEGGHAAPAQGGLCDGRGGGRPRVQEKLAARSRPEGPPRPPGQPVHLRLAGGKHFQWRPGPGGQRGGHVHQVVQEREVPEAFRRLRRGVRRHYLEEERFRLQDHWGVATGLRAGHMHRPNAADARAAEGQGSSKDEARPAALRDRQRPHVGPTGGHG